MLPRGWLDDPIFRDKFRPTSRRSRLCGSSNNMQWAPRDGWNGGSRASLRALADAWKWHVCWRLRFLRDLIVKQLIDFRGTIGRTNSTLIIICNYGDFHVVPSRRGTISGTKHPKKATRVKEEEKNLPIPLKGDCPPVNGRTRRRRMTANEKLWKGRADAVEAVLARDAARAVNGSDAPVAALLDSGRSDRIAPDAIGGLDRGSPGIPAGDC